MAALEVWLLGAALLAFVAMVALLTARTRSGDRTFSRFADSVGWDHQTTAPAGPAAAMAARLGVAPADGVDLYLAGPSAIGPFRLVRRGGPGRSGWTFLHLRTVARTAGVRLMPAPRFAPTCFGRSATEAAFLRRFAVGGADADAVQRLQDDGAMTLLLRPGAPVRLLWEDHDLIIGFPLGVASPRGAGILLRYGVALARALSGDVPPQPVRSALSAPTPAVALRPGALAD